MDIVFWPVDIQASCNDLRKLYIWACAVPDVSSSQTSAWAAHEPEQSGLAEITPADAQLPVHLLCCGVELAVSSLPARRLSGTLANALTASLSHSACCRSACPSSRQALTTMLTTQGAHSCQPLNPQTPSPH